jgi:hypothetical protein
MTSQSIEIKSTVYPFEYNKNNPMTGFNDWALYIRAQLEDQPQPDKLVIEAKKILTLKFLQS